MDRHRFRAVVEAATGGGAAARIPADVTAALGGRRQMRVTGTLNGTPIRTSTMPYGGGFYVGLHKAAREQAGVGIGDEVELELVRDDAPRVLDLPPELEAALEAEPSRRERFDGLSFSRRRELSAPIAEARRPQTRAARVEKALAALRALPTRPKGEPVIDFLQAVEPARRRAQGLQLLDVFREETGVEPRLWGPSIVGFGQYRYTYASGRSGETMRVGFSPRKAALTLYGLTLDGSNADLLDPLGKHRVGKGCVYLNSLEDVDLGVLRRLIRRAWEGSEQAAR